MGIQETEGTEKTFVRISRDAGIEQKIPVITVRISLHTGKKTGCEIKPALSLITIQAHYIWKS